MQEFFNDILSVEGVKGLILFSFIGDILFKEINHTALNDIGSRDFRLFIQSLTGIRETDLIFEKGRFYIRRTDVGYLLVLIESFIPIAMIRLQCDILLPALKPAKTTKGLRRFFRVKNC